MPHKALALKWRPQTLSQLIGQQAVQTALAHALKTGRLHPAYLFAGPRGTGKTSLARITAKTIRCRRKKDPLQPCLACEECLLIQKGQSLDVLEIDGASANGVEAIRDLKSALHHMPFSGEKKIYIIDEVHMLSTGAFNALLKTLEEPPSHVLFIMATTEAQKIPLTVISRCQKFDFLLIPVMRIQERLKEIAQSEQAAVEEKALWLIAREAHGSLRDSQSLLDRMIASCGEDEKITFEKTAQILCQTPPALLFQTLKALCEKNEIAVAAALSDLRNKGVPARLFLQNVVEGLRDLLALKINPENRPPLVSRSQEEIEEMKAFSAPINYEDLHFLFSIALQGERDLSFCHDSLLALDVLLLKLAGAPRLETIAPASPFREEKAGAGGLKRKEKKEDDERAPPGKDPSLMSKKTRPFASGEISHPAGRGETDGAKGVSTDLNPKKEPFAGGRPETSRSVYWRKKDSSADSSAALKSKEKPKEASGSLKKKPLEAEDAAGGKRMDLKNSAVEKRLPEEIIKAGGGALQTEEALKETPENKTAASRLEKKDSFFGFNGGEISAAEEKGWKAADGPSKTEGLSLQALQELWLKFLDRLMEKSVVLSGIVENLSLKGKEGGAFIFFEPDPFIKTKFNKNKELLIKELDQFLQKPGFSIHFQKNHPAGAPAVSLKRLKMEREKRLLWKKALKDPLCAAITAKF